jgi:DNA-binding NarL/FixJ family response regulator
VARDLTNEEIAAELFVTLKTVETHLTHTYAKLELSGPRMRRRLAALIRETAAA